MYSTSAATLTPVQLEDVVEQCTIEAALGLFRAYRVLLDYAYATERAVMPELCLCGVVGFVGRQMSGTMVLAATPEPLIWSNPTSASSQEWIAELSNQLFGRIRNRLLRRGLELIGTPPEVMRGERLEALTERKRCRPVVLRGAADGKVCVWLDRALEDGLPIPLIEVEPASPTVAEGTILLF